MADTPVVMISSTARDLPDERAQATNAILRLGMSPKIMEAMAAMDADAIAASMALVDKADVFVGIFAHRYGEVPDGHDKSITEMEYDRAVERGIPRLIFLMDEDVPVLPKDVDKGESAAKLQALKERLKKERVVGFFNSPEDLRGQVLHALVEWRERVDQDRAPLDAKQVAAGFHHVAVIPSPPEPYVAHEYTLLRGGRLVGRQEELEHLTDWVTGAGDLADVRIYNLVALGGVGKSALSWHFFNDVLSHEMKPLDGALWWSFYESDASFDNFVIRALAYVSGQDRETLRTQTTAHERQDELLRHLGQRPYFLVLDGPGADLDRLFPHGRGVSQRRRVRPEHGQLCGRGPRAARGGRAILHRPAPSAGHGRSAGGSVLTPPGQASAGLDAGPG